MVRRQSLVRLAIALLGVITVGTAARSVRSPGVIGTGSGSTPDAEPALATSVYQYPDYVGAILAVLALSVLVAFVWLSVTHPSDIVQWAGKTVVLVLLFSVVAGTLLMIDFPGGADTENETRQEPPSGELNASDDGVEGEEPEETLPSLPVAEGIVILGWLFVLLAGAVVINGRRTATPTDDEAPEAPDPDPAGLDDETAAGIGAAAAAAAADIDEDADPDNEIYRAWASMAAQVDVDDPETSTPGEFAAAAVEAGMDPGDVEALTDLFEAVRYGDTEVTPERADRARETFERIAEQYGDHR